MFENPRRGRQARNFTTNAPKILDIKSSSEQIFSRKLPLGAPDYDPWYICNLLEMSVSKVAPPGRRGKLERKKYQSRKINSYYDIKACAYSQPLPRVFRLSDCSLSFPNAK